MYHVTFSV